MNAKQATTNAGRRILLRGVFPNADELREVVIVEVSPSQKCVKLRHESGAVSWEDLPLNETIQDVLP